MIRGSLFNNSKLRVDNMCLNCNNYFYVPFYRNGRAKFCSSKCYGHHRKNNPELYNHGFQKGDKNWSKNHNIWCKGLTKYNCESIRCAIETRKNLLIKRNLYGENNPFYGKRHTEEAILKIRKARAKQNFSFTNSSIELKVQNFLKQLGIEYFIHFCINEIEHAYNCDIFVPSMNLIIECDGDYFHGNPSLYPLHDLNKKQKEQRWRDEVRNKELIEKGFNILRLWENEIISMDIKTFNDKMLQYGRTP